MSKMEIKERVLAILSQIDFSESQEVRLDCPKCHKKGSVIRRISMEKQQKMKGKWYVEHCEEDTCDYWDSGFL